MRIPGAISPNAVWGPTTRIDGDKSLAAGLDDSLVESSGALMSKGGQIVPFGSSRFQKTDPCSFYFAIYEPPAGRSESARRGFPDSSSGPQDRRSQRRHGQGRGGELHPDGQSHGSGCLQPAACVVPFGRLPGGSQGPARGGPRDGHSHGGLRGRVSRGPTTIRARHGWGML